jgi:hypothetical protein
MPLTYPPVSFWRKARIAGQISLALTEKRQFITGGPDA